MVILPNIDKARCCKFQDCSYDSEKDSLVFIDSGSGPSGQPGMTAVAQPVFFDSPDSGLFGAQSICPPSTAMFWHVTQLASGEQRNSTICATSSGRPRRPNGMLLRMRP